jgi:hypothetical protein
MTVPFNHVAFTTALADSRGRPIHLHPHHSPPAPCGVWIALPPIEGSYIGRSCSVNRSMTLLVIDVAHEIVRLHALLSNAIPPGHTLVLQ